MIRQCKFKLCIFLFLVLFNSVVYDIPAGQTDVTTPLDIILLLDASGSMLNNDPDGFQKQGAKTFIQQMIDIDNVGIVVFSEQAKLLVPLSPATDEFKQRTLPIIDDIETRGKYTNISAGVKLALEQLVGERKHPSSIRAVLLCTDGKIDVPGGEPVMEQVKKNFNFWLDICKESNIRIYSVTFTGTMADYDVLQDIAAKTRGSYEWVASSEELTKVFGGIYAKLDKGRRQEKIEEPPKTAVTATEESWIGKFWLPVAVIGVIALFIVLAFIFRRIRAKRVYQVATLEVQRLDDSGETDTPPERDGEEKIPKGQINLQGGVHVRGRDGKERFETQPKIRRREPSEEQKTPNAKTQREITSERDNEEQSPKRQINLQNGIHIRRRDGLEGFDKQMKIKRGKPSADQEK